MYPKILLKTKREASLIRYHPWVFSGAIQRIEGMPGEGDVVEVCSSSGEYLATGHYQESTIAVKILSFEQVPIDGTFFSDAIQKAYRFRESAGLVQNPLTNAYRLVFSEGDSLPGLVIDWYNGVAVLQAQSAGMLKSRTEISEALKLIYGSALKAIYVKSSQLAVGSSRLPVGSSRLAVGIRDHFLFGSCEDTGILETGHKFRVDFIRGQKTGFFLDQRSNRMFAQYYAKGRKVLNAFCYSGAFSVYALKGGASLVHSVDSSPQAIEWAREHIRMNGIAEDLHEEFVADVKDFLPGLKQNYDLIILDPPAFAKSHKVTHNALQAYIHINSEAMKKLNPGGILFTFSCSQAISREVFRSAVQSAAIEARQSVKVLHHLSQGPDHPVSIFHPEGDYLKGLIVVAE
ncbi:MAG: class I SAM-dependent rRNA methyltransferase [bacterium]